MINIQSVPISIISNFSTQMFYNTVRLKQNGFSIVLCVSMLVPLDTPNRGKDEDHLWYCLSSTRKHDIPSLHNYLAK